MKLIVIKEEYINKFLNGRQFFILTAVLYVVLTWLATTGSVPQQKSVQGICFDTDVLSLLPPMVSTLLAVVSVLGVSLLMSFLNKASTFVRDVTYIFSSTYLLLAIANPMESAYFNEGSLLSIVMMLLTVLVFGTYQEFHAQRKVYISFVILACCCMINYAFAPMMIVLALGFVQMRVMNLRSALAIIFGIVTPFWIALGTGLVGISGLRWHDITVVWNNDALLQSVKMLTVVVFTVVVALSLFGANVLQLISYKLQTRSYNGFFIVLMLVTMLAMVIDGGNVMAYLPVLNVCLSVQMAHTFTLAKNVRKYIMLLMFVALCVGSYVWQVFY